MLEEKHFEEKVVTLINAEGEQIDVDRVPQEQWHYETFKRVNDSYLPGFLEGYTSSLKNYNGFDFAVISAMQKYTLFMSACVSNADTIILSLPEVVSANQKKTIGKILPELRDRLLYVMICASEERDGYILPSILDSYSIEKGKKKCLRDVVRHCSNQKDIKPKQKNKVKSNYK